MPVEKAEVAIVSASWAASLGRRHLAGHERPVAVDESP